MPKRREFSAKVKLQAWERAGGKCEHCTARLYPGKYEFDHVIPDALGGEPVLGNIMLLCAACHGRKTAERDHPAIAKSRRVQAKRLGIKRRPGGGFRGWRRFDGSIVWNDKSDNCRKR